MYTAIFLNINACGTTQSNSPSDTESQLSASPQNTIVVNTPTESLSKTATNSVAQSKTILQLQANDAISDDEELKIDRDANQEVNSGDILHSNSGHDTIFGVYPCVNSETIKFVAPLFKYDLITAIIPMGKVSAGSGHVTPTDHLYIHRNPPAGKDEEYILVPADGTLVHIGRFPEDQP